MLSILTSGLSKALIGLLLVAGIFAGVYAYGHSKGSDAGYASGVAAEQPTILGLTKTINDSRTAVATKVDALQVKTASAVVASVQQQAVKTVVRTQIVDHYHTVEKVVASQCGLSNPSVLAINAALATQIIYDGASNEDPN
jgi:hypothetical protein